MDQFSTTLKLTNLDDYITPSVECIKPVEIPKSSKSTSAKITITNNNVLYQSDDTQSVKRKLERVEINLSDCLACSGCITSAETVLVTQQSSDELLKVFEENAMLKKELPNSPNAKQIVVSISLQPILSLAIKYQMSPEDAAAKLVSFFKTLGADYVMDMSFANRLAIAESQQEFLDRHRDHQRPILASNCPGFVCYAEKKYGQLLTPLISRVKSPQQIMGSLVKKAFRHHFEKEVYHVTIMPCYDKKLEAFRDEFFDKNRNEREVDCVLTSIEIEQLLQKRNETLTDYENGIFNEFLLNDFEKPIEKIERNIGSGSGGYSDSIFMNAVQVLGQKLYENESDLHYKLVKNADFKEISFDSDNIHLKFCIVNGFKNIQNFVQKLKMKKIDYDYVEIMACPSGCLNGGAQNHNTVDFLPSITKMYAELPIEKSRKRIKIDESLIVKDDLYTTYKNIEKSTFALNIKW